MARINLLPWRTERRKQREREFYMQLAPLRRSALLLRCSCDHAGWARASTTRTNATRTCTNEIKQLDKQIEEIKELDKTKSQLLTRKQIIEQLQSNRSQMVHLFDEMVKTIPASVRLTSLKQAGDILTLEGVAESNARVASYMRNIDSSPWMGRADLRKIENKAGTKDVDKKMPYVFSLDVKLRKPEDAQTEKERSPKAPQAGAAAGRAGSHSRPPSRRSPATRRRQPSARRPRAGAGPPAPAAPAAKERRRERRNEFLRRSPKSRPQQRRRLAEIDQDVLRGADLRADPACGLVVQDPRPAGRPRDSSSSKEETLKKDFPTSRPRSSTSTAYRKQLEDMKEMLRTMLRQLPSKTEMPELLVDISQTALAAGIVVDLFQPGAEVVKEFYAEKPIQLKMLGTYHQFGTFISGVASLPRVVILTMHDVSLRPARRHQHRRRRLSHRAVSCSLEGTVKTYRYVDDDEAAAAQAAPIRRRRRAREEASAEPAKKGANDAQADLHRLRSHAWRSCSSHSAAARRATICARGSRRRRPRRVRRSIRCP